MEEIRKKRYLEKIELIRKRLEDIGLWKSDFFTEEKDRLAVYKAIQEIWEACMDIVAMMVKDMGKTPEDDYTNISKLAKLISIPDKIKQGLVDLNGLRNRVVHEYNGLDDRIAFDSMEDILPPIKNFMDVVEKWIKEK